MSAPFLVRRMLALVSLAVLLCVGLDSSARADTPAVVSDAPGRLDIFARSPIDNTLLARSYNSGGWGAWRSLGGQLKVGSDIAAVSDRPGHIIVFVIGTDGRIYQRDWTDTGGWGGFNAFTALPDTAQVPGGATNGPAAVVWKSGGQASQIHVFSRGPEDANGVATLWQSPWNSGQGWVAARSLGGQLARGVGVGATARASGWVDVVVTNDSRKLYLKQYRPSTGWTAFAPTDNAAYVNGTPGISAPINRLNPSLDDPAGREDYIVNSGNSVWQQVYQPASQTFTGWNALGGTIKPLTGIAPLWWQQAAGAADRFDLFTYDTNDEVIQRAWTPATNWGGWDLVNSTTYGDAAAGGENAKIDSDAEAARFLATFLSASSDTRAKQLYNGLSVDSKTTVDVYARARVADPSLLLDVTTGTRWWAKAGYKQLISSASEAAAVGATWALYARTTPGVLDRLNSLNSGLAPLSRRSDPSVDEYLTNPSFRTAVQSQFSTFVAHDSAPNVSFDTIPWLGSRVYFNSTGVLAYDSTRIAQTSQWLIRSDPSPTQYNFSTKTADPRPSTEVLSDGETVPRLSRIDDYYMLDLRIPAAQNWWLYGADGVINCPSSTSLRGALDLVVGCGYKGLWLDNVDFSLYHWSFQKDASGARVYPSGISETDWDNALSQLLGRLRAALPAGVPYTINTKWNDNGLAYNPSINTIDATTPYGRELAAAAQVVMEGGALWGDADAADAIDGAVTRAPSLRRQFLYADQLHAIGGRMQWEIVGDVGFPGITGANCNEQFRLNTPGFNRWSVGSQIWTDHNRVAEFNEAAALLAYAQGDGVGDMCEYPNRGWAGYGKSIGQPTGGRAEPIAHIIVRYFTNGAVVMNTGASPTSYTLTTRAAVSVGAPVGTAASTVVPLAPQSARVLQYVS